MIISKGKLILGLIPFMTYYFSDPLLCQFMLFQADCALAGNKYCFQKNKSFLCFSSRVMASALGVTPGKAATSFWEMSSPFEEGSSCVFVTNPPA